MVLPVSCWTLGFFESGLERDYGTAKAEAVRRMYRIISGFGLVVFLVFLAPIGTAPYGTEENFAVHRGLGLVIVGPLMVALVSLGYARAEWFRRGWEPLVALACMSTPVTWALSLLVAPEPQRIDLGAMLSIVTVVTVAAGTAFSLRFVITAPALAISNLALLLAISTLESPSSGSAPLLIGTTLFSVIAAYQLDRRDRLAFHVGRQLAQEHGRAEGLLRNVLPEVIGARLKRGEVPVADQFDSATVMFADLVGFTQATRTLGSEAMVKALDTLFSRFDDLADRHGLEKIKTIGDAYMVVAGVPVPRADHARAAAALALDIRDAVADSAPFGAQALRVRIGLHSGPVVAGVIGKRKFIYDVWGDTVNIASRLESHGVPGEIHLSGETSALLGDAFVLESRGLVELKGIGPRPTAFLRRRDD